ncbi:MAG: RNA 2'-phosphotransferase [Candidatus Nezhaarchaeales archaeon]
MPAELILDPHRRLRLSKLLTAILRHVPETIGLTLDSEGWIDIDELVNKIKSYKPHYNWITKDIVKAIAMLDPKGRFELKENAIRARYGHARRLNVKINYQEDKEKKILYHGTSAANLKSILKEGIKPMKRHMVHLAASIQDAIETALRKDRNIVIFEIDAEKLRKEGFKIYKASDKIYVTSYVPPSAIKKYEVMTCKLR